ncbi:hypothetical protein TNCV_1753121 [Trichonephila clavipes]|nr:hypothetical protein TNCV_1753121 [Trichonephila clavipes]
MEGMYPLARYRIGMSHEKMKARHGAKATGHYFHEGDKVFLWNLERRKGLSPKLNKLGWSLYTLLDNC